MTAEHLTFVEPAGVSPPAGNTYSHAVVANGVVYVAGQVGVDPTGKLCDGFEAQARQAFDNLRLVLAAANAELADVVKVQVLLADSAELRTYRGLRAEFLPQRPASTLYVPKAFAMPGLLFEIEAIAVPAVNG